MKTKKFVFFLSKKCNNKKKHFRTAGTKIARAPNIKSRHAVTPAVDSILISKEFIKKVYLGKLLDIMSTITVFKYGSLIAITLYR